LVYHGDSTGYDNVISTAQVILRWIRRVSILQIKRRLQEVFGLDEEIHGELIAYSFIIILFPSISGDYRGFCNWNYPNKSCVRIPVHEMNLLLQDWYTVRSTCRILNRLSPTASEPLADTVNTCYTLCICSSASEKGAEQIDLRHLARMLFLFYISSCLRGLAKIQTKVLEYSQVNLQSTHSRRFLAAVRSAPFDCTPTGWLTKKILLLLARLFSL
jgi:hypothetical protein